MKRIFIIYSYGTKFAERLNNHAVSAYSAQSAFFVILSAFPFAMVFFSLIRYMPFTQTELMDTAYAVFPIDLGEYIRSIVDDIYVKSNGAVVSISTLVALWSASRGFYSIIKGLDSVYEVNEKRGYFMLKFATIIYTLIFIIMMVIILGLFVFGDSIFSRIIEDYPNTENFLVFLKNFRWVIGIVLLTVFFTTIFTFLAKRKARFLSQLPGAVIATLGWLGFSLLYSVYVERFANFSYIYGSLSAIVLLMMWLYFCMNIMFVGAEINSLFSGNYRFVQIAHEVITGRSKYAVNPFKTIDKQKRL